MTKSPKKRSLGRGLSVLMADMDKSHTPPSGVKAQPDVIILPIDQISANPNQPRKRFDNNDLDELAASIRNKGILQPLIVRPHEQGYQIVAGERRWQAAQRAQLHEVPVLVRELDDAEMLEIAIIENIQRSDLNPIEEATGYRQLMNRFGYTQDQLSEALGKSRSYIANLLRLLHLPDDVVEMVAQGALTAGHARTLITSENPRALANQVIKNQLSVRATEVLAKKEQKKNKQEKQARQAARKDPDTTALENDLMAVLGLKVNLTHLPGQENGQLILHYRSLSELDDLCRKLSSDV